MVRSSVAAVGVAAHECGHAIQHQKNYAPLTIRGAIVPVANIGSTLAWPLILIGLFISSRSGQALITAGIICFSLAVLFQIVTLPVEFNASRRAVRILGETGILGEQELGYTRKVLGAAALTYVAGAASAILQLLRLILLFGGRRDDLDGTPDNTTDYRLHFIHLHTGKLIDNIIKFQHALQFAYPDKKKAYKQYLSVTCSIPEWMITLWEKNYSLERI